MKTLLLLFCLLPVLAMAQPGYITTIAGNGTSGFSGDGGPATSAQLGQVSGVCADNYGNVYIQDNGNGRIRKVNTAGVITTFAGGGLYTSDGIPATTACICSLTSSALICDNAGNVYFGDDNRVRKISPSGIITTVAGAIAAGFSGDGGPATAAEFNIPVGLCFDAYGNLYIGDQDNNRIRKINTAGIISTVAGTGTGGFAGDGGPATAAQLQSPAGICFDASGNMYVSDRNNNRIRRIDASGIITTFAGSGVSGFSGDGGPATAAQFNQPSQLVIDHSGNFYIADFHNNRVRMINSSGVISTFAGGGSSLANGIPATTASFSNVWGIGVDNADNPYIADQNHHRICLVGSGIPFATADSFSVFLSSTCAGPSIVIGLAHYTTSFHVKTWFGDGSSQTDTFTSSTGYAFLDHHYTTPGIYTMKHILYHGSTAIDSTSYSYSFTLCNAFQLSFYYDANNNCIKDGAEGPLSGALTIAVDSNGVTVDTLSALSGLYYLAYGSPGDVYAFRVVSCPPDIHVTCPATGVIYDTMGTGTFSVAKKMGLECGGSADFDLSGAVVIPVTGRNDQWGNIYVQNSYCTPAAGTLSLHYSSKYMGMPSQVNPAAASVSVGTIVWNLSGLSSTSPTPTRLHWEGESGGTLLTISDTVHTSFRLTPMTGDADTTNNIFYHNDTVKAGCDPNAMWVKPETCITSGVLPTQLQYIINFENTGNDTAHNIYIMDTLSDYVDANSMRLVLSSHEMYVSKLRYDGHNILEFDFPKINLLDSSHHALCDGAVIFNIDTKPGLSDGTNIRNRAGIYFDINSVVMTNETSKIIACLPEGISTPGLNTDEVIIYPNPANDVLNIDANRETFKTYAVTNSMGEAVLQGSLGQAHTQVFIKQLPAGIYFVCLRGEGGSVVKKLAKW